MDELKIAVLCEKGEDAGEKFALFASSFITKAKAVLDEKGVDEDLIDDIDKLCREGAVAAYKIHYKMYLESKGLYSPRS